jgi:hypothetical protein
MWGLSMRYSEVVPNQIRRFNGSYFIVLEVPNLDDDSDPKRVYVKLRFINTGIITDYYDLSFVERNSCVVDDS